MIVRHAHATTSLPGAALYIVCVGLCIKLAENALLTFCLELNNVEENSDNQNLILQESPYYDCDSFKTLIHPVDINTNNFSILSTNIQSIHAKFNELQAFVKDMQSVQFNFSVICIQESWLKDADDTSLIHLDDYTCIYHKDDPVVQKEAWLCM